MTVLPLEVTDHAASTADLLVAAIRAGDDARPRTQQVEIGPSALGGCRRRVFYQLRGVEPVNETERLPSSMGTGVHKIIEDGIALLDPARSRYLTEIEVPGIPEFGIKKGHVDLYDAELHKITDWKSTTKKNLRWFPKQNQRWQVQVYGLLMVKAGYTVRHVELAAIPRDGTSKTIRVHTEPYDPAVAMEAIAWLKEVENMERNDITPNPECSGVMCTDYCPFYGPPLCPGG